MGDVAALYLFGFIAGLFMLWLVVRTVSNAWHGAQKRQTTDCEHLKTELERLKAKVERLESERDLAISDRDDALWERDAAMALYQGAKESGSPRR